MNVEFFYRTSRGATAMKFLDVNLARNWYRNQKEKHGSAMPDMQLIKQTVTVNEEIIDEPFSITTCTGRTVVQVPAYAQIEVGIPRLQGI